MNASIKVDQAMEQRNWAMSSAYYTNTTVVSSPNGVPYRPKLNDPAWSYPILDPGIFLGDVLIYPITAFKSPPGSESSNRGASFEPTYTAAPPQ